MHIVKKFPNPFVFNDGSLVKTKEDWFRRCEEIKKLVLDVEYGTSPPPPEVMETNILESQKSDGILFYQKILLTIVPKKSEPNIKFSFIIHIRFPFDEIIEDKKETIPEFGKNGFPCIIYVGNSPLFECIEEGYVVVCYENDQLDPMELGNPIVGPAQSAYEELDPMKYSWGSIAVWAWGAQRVLDYILTREEINPNQIIISGHSRNGKTALLAGATDERFSIVAPAGSGCAGAGSLLAIGEGCESIASLTDRRRWWNWTEKDFELYAFEFRGENKRFLPFDQHFVMGLVAPRPLFRAEGDEDTWANPEGTCCSFLATEPIYEFLGAERWNQLFFHNGGHHHGSQDLQALLEMSDCYFFDIPQDHIHKSLLPKIPEKKFFMEWDTPTK